MAQGLKTDAADLPARRAFMASGALAVTLTIAGCTQGKPTFSSVDITGATFGRDFALPDPAGRPRSLAEFRGKVVLLFFGFTFCPDVCPTALSRAVEVRRQLGADGERVQVLFVTVDPERDTAGVLQRYTGAFDDSFLGLRGSLEETRQTAKEFKVHYAKVPTGSSYTMEHTAMTYAFDPQGRIRLAIPHSLGAEEMAADLRALLAQS